ncbi:MAG: hypothetical protein Q4B15_03250 [Lachnospiraceae bacterium]|nr:hypothetical protein [Lachnospiraceae bacterium]
MNKNLFNLQLFAETNTTMAADLEPAISVDFVSKLTSNITELQNLLGVVNLTPMSSGSVVKIYKTVVGTIADQVAEGETIGLTKVERKLADTIELTLNKYRKNTTAEAILKSGRSIAVNETDSKMVSAIRKSVKDTFYAALATGTGAATGTTLQAGLAQGWGAVKKFYETQDLDASPIYFISSDDVATYLASAQVTLQTAFGFDYIENFLGLGTAIVTPSLAAGTAYATAKENLNGAYVPANSGDIADTFGLTSDETGLVGMTHAIKTDNASVDTLLFSGVTFYPEYTDGVIKISITGA